MPGPQLPIFRLTRSTLCGLLSAQLLLPQAKPATDVPMVTFKANVVAKTTKAINYRHRSGATRIDFRGTALLPTAKDAARVETKQGYIEIDADFRGLQPAYVHGAEYLTYVLWAITP